MLYLKSHVQGHVFWDTEVGTPMGYFFIQAQGLFFLVHSKLGNNLRQKEHDGFLYDAKHNRNLSS